LTDVGLTTDTHAPGPSLRGGPGRRVSRFLHAHRSARLGLTLTPALSWLLIVYIGSLAALLITSLYTTNPLTTAVVKDVSLDNFRDLLENDVYRTVTFRTIGVAAAVTIIDVIIAIPSAFFIAKVVRPSFRKALVVGVLLPLWASYLVKAYAWRALLDPVGGVMEKSFGWSPGYGLTATIIVLAYLWLPYMVLPIYAGLDRLPDSLLEASGDLGAKGFRTFRSVVMPVIWPAVAAGSVFTFSLSMGDYIAVGLVGGTTQMLGNTIRNFFGVPNLPFAAALAVIPVIAMIFYLLAIRRTGALESL
jgi:putative spermidine/putrescine transport system permease protein